MTVTMIAATSLDGFIAQESNERSFNWTSPEDKKFYVSELKKADAIVIGRKTFETINKFPRDSRWIIYTSQPEGFENPRPEVIQAQASMKSPAELVKELADQGVENLLIAGGASVYTLFLKAGVVDKMFLTVESVVFGSGVSLFSESFEPYLQPKLESTRQLSDQTILFEYYFPAKHKI